MQSNNNKNNSNNTDLNGFKLVGKKDKKNKKVEVVVVAKVPVPAPKSNKPIITCTLCQKPGHIKDKCFRFIREQQQIEKLKSTECSYCHALGHPNFDCPVSKANAEKKKQFIEKQKQKEAKFEEDFPQALLKEAKQKDNSGPVLKFAWASVAMANRDPVKVQKIEKEEAVLKEAIKLVEKEQAEQTRESKKQAKLAASKEKWLEIRPVILALKAAFPKTWIYKVENTSYDIKEANLSRYEADCRREELDAEEERLEWEENERNYKESRKREAKRANMTQEELEEDYRRSEEEYEDAMMNEQNQMFSRIFRVNCRPNRPCVDCSEWLEQDNQGSRCIACIFQLGPYLL
jgi:hypothetical protein